MFLPLNFPPEDTLLPSEHLGEAGQALAAALAPVLPPDLYREAVTMRLLRTAAYRGRLQGLAFRLGEHTLWGHLLLALGWPEDDRDILLQLETQLGGLAGQTAWASLAEAPTLRGAQANPVLAVVADLAPTPVYPLIGADVQRVLRHALAQWGWPDEHLPKRLLNPLSALRRVAPAFQGAILTDFAAALEASDEAALVETVWAACGQLRRLDGSEEPLSPATRRRYYYEFITWALGLRRITPPEAPTSAEGSSAAKPASSSTTVSPPQRLPQPGRRWPRLRRPAWDDDDDPPEDQAPDGYRLAAYRRAVAAARRGTAPDEDLAETLLPSPLAETAALPPWLLAESRRALERSPFLWDWQALPPDGWAEVVRFALQRSDAAALLLATSALTGRPFAWLAAAVCGGGTLPAAADQPPAYDRHTHTLVYYPTVWAHLPRQPQKPEMFLPVAAAWRLPLPAALVSRWQALAGGKDAGEPLFSPDAADKAKGLLAALGARWRRKHPADAPFTPGRLRRSWAYLMQTVGGLDPLLTGWLSGLWPDGHYPPLYYTTLTLPWLAQRYEAALQRVGRKLRLPLNVPALPPRPLWPMGSVYHPRLSVLRKAVRALTQAVQEAPNASARHNARTLLALYGLALFLGLRLGEAGRLRVGQFDFLATWQGERLPWLMLHQAKGNRFTTAARLVPLPFALTPLLDELVDAAPGADLTSPAFGFDTPRGWQPATPEAIRTRLQQVGVPVPRWHAGRHLLRSFLLRYGMPHEGVNLILGHQAAGEEAWNPYRTVDIGGYFRQYRYLSDTLAALLRWPDDEVNAKTQRRQKAQRG